MMPIGDGIPVAGSPKRDRTVKEVASDEGNVPVRLGSTSALRGTGLDDSRTNPTTADGQPQPDGRRSKLGQQGACSGARKVIVRRMATGHVRFRETFWATQTRLLKADELSLQVQGIGAAGDGTTIKTDRRP